MQLSLPRFPRWDNLPHILTICTLLAASGLNAQTTSGSLTGTVIDQQLAAVSGANVTLKDASKGVAQAATSDREGRFTFPIVPPGNYIVSIEAKGFKKTERTDLLMVANDKLALGNVTLEVGATTDTVSVTAEATLRRISP